MKFLIILFCFGLSFSSFSDPNEVELRWNHFISKAYKNTTQLNDYVFLTMDRNFNYDMGVFRFNSSFKGEYSLDHDKLIYYSAPEAYISYRYKFDIKRFNLDSIGISFGRKVHSWSVSDEYWDFGLWNPVNRWNPLHATSKGLLGTFLSMESEDWSIDMLVGGMYLPSSYTKTELKDGKILSSYRWFSGVPNKVDVLGRGLLDVEYLVKIPFILDIFLQQSYALSLKTWLNKAHTVWAKWGYSYKPVNDLLIVTNTDHILEITDMQISQKVTILPVKHIILSSEWGFKHEKFSAVLSFGHNSVQEDKEVPEGWEYLHDRGYFTYISTLMKYNFSDKNYFQVSYLNSWYDGTSSKKENYQDSKTPFIFSQYKILNGVGFDFHLEYLSKSGFKRQVDFNYKYSFPNKGGLLSVQATYYVSSQIYTSITADILGAKDVDQEYFLNKFRANDYFGWRLGYVF